MSLYRFFKLFISYFQKGGGTLGRITEAVLRTLEDVAKSIEVVSVYSDHDLFPSGQLVPAVTPDQTLQSSATVWLSARQVSGDLMDAIKLQGLIALRSKQVNI